MYYVKSWDTDEILSTHKTLAIARRYCRGQGHGEVAGASYVPIAYVADEDGHCVYSPRFGTQINAEGIINANDHNIV